MNALLFFEQTLNGLQLGLMLFLLASGLTLIFGIMNFVNLAHGSLYMLGAYGAAHLANAGWPFWAALLGAVLGVALFGALLERVLIRRFYRSDVLTQVLLTFALILIANDTVKLIWGAAPLRLNAPAALASPVELWPGFVYASYRLLIIGVGLALALALWWGVARTRLGCWVRAGASDREMAQLMGVPVQRLFGLVFALGAGLCAVAGALLGPVLAVEVGMGENILILALVVVVIGGVGSVRGAFFAALLVGMVDTAGRAFLFPALAALAIYLLMALVLIFKPTGLFPAR